jgi:quinol monooxygenase YgiN
MTMTEDKTTAATGPSVVTLDSKNGYVTTMNTYTVPAERVEEVLQYLVRSANETVRFVPGFLSFSFHVSFDRTQIVNYGQWKSREALGAARQDPRIVALMAETAKIAGPSKSAPFDMRQSVFAAE